MDGEWNQRFAVPRRLGSFFKGRPPGTFAGGGAAPIVKRAPPLAGGSDVATPNGDGEEAGGTGEVLGCPKVNVGAALA